MRRREALPAALLAALGTWSAAVHADPAPPAPGDLVRWPASLPLLDGTTWSAAPDHAHIVVFWSTTCPFCKAHNVHVEKLHRALAGRRARIIGVTRDADPALVQRHLALNQLTFPVTQAHQPLAAALSPRRVIPLTVTVDRGGRLRQVIAGEMFEEDVMELAKLAS